MKKLIIVGISLLLVVSGVIYLLRGKDKTTVKDTQKTTQKNVKKNIKKRVEIKPDGTKIITVEDTSTIDSKSDEKTKEIVKIVSKKSNYRLDIGVRTDIIETHKPNLVPEVKLGKRILGPIWFSGSINKNKEIGVWVGFEF